MCPFAHKGNKNLAEIRVTALALALLVLLTHKAHADGGSKYAAAVLALLAREPDERLGSPLTGGAPAVLAHPWFRGVTADEVLHKRLAPPWIPFSGAAPSETPEGLVAGHGRGAEVLAAELEAERRVAASEEELREVLGPGEWDAVRATPAEGEARE